MTSSVRNINWDYPGDAIPSFITMAVMPFTYSIGKDNLFLIHLSICEII
jgi:xanthine/uracil/vitamin C permease (AzgA family)